ncbi:hypothetical protein QYF61_011575, partial [Mycteria americana]
MTAALPSLALALLCLLRAGAEVPVQPGFDAEKVLVALPNPTGDVLLQFAGTWHVAAAVSNCPEFLKMKNGMKSSIATISFTPEGDLAMKLVWPLLDKCQKFELLFQRSGQAGHYMGTWAAEVPGLCHVAQLGTIWGPLAAQEKRELRVMETDYGHYAIVHELQQSGQESRTALQLLTREQDASPQLLQKFEELIPTTGLTKDMLAVLPKSGECQEDQCTKAI